MKKSNVKILNIVAIILVLLTLIPFGVYFYNYHGALVESIDTWAQAGTFIYSFAILALTALNIIVMLMVNETLQSNQNKQYEQTSKFEEHRLKLIVCKDLMNDFLTANAKIMEEIEKLNEDHDNNLEALTHYCLKAHNVLDIMKQSNSIFPSIKTEITDDYIKIISKIADCCTIERKVLLATFVPSIKDVRDDVNLYYDEIRRNIQKDIEHLIDETITK